MSDSTFVTEGIEASCQPCAVTMWCATLAGAEAWYRAHMEVVHGIKDVRAEHDRNAPSRKRTT